MKNLIIHPKDHTTNCLSQIYAQLANKTVITGGVTKSELRHQIEIHDRIIMLGHGTHHGMLSVGQFPDAEYCIVDGSMIGELWNKTNNVYIWCHADFFLNMNSLNGLCCGMFISEIGEAIDNNFEDSDWDLITESNDVFAFIMAKHINESIDELYRNLVSEYGELAKRNPIAKFNHERLYLIQESLEDRIKWFFGDDFKIDGFVENEENT
jgi:hypothetical protein